MPGSGTGVGLPPELPPLDELLLLADELGFPVLPLEVLLADELGIPELVLPLLAEELGLPELLLLDDDDELVGGLGLGDHHQVAPAGLDSVSAAAPAISRWMDFTIRLPLDP